MERKEWVYLGGGLLDEVDTGVKLSKFVVAAAGVGEDLYAIEAHKDMWTKHFVSKQRG